MIKSADWGFIEERKLNEVERELNNFRNKLGREYNFDYNQDTKMIEYWRR